MGKRIKDLTDDEITKRLCDVEEGLSEWETEFVDSVRRRVLVSKQRLTPRQREVCERIAEEKT